MNFKVPVIRDEKFRRFVASLPCVITGIVGQSQCAHIRSRCYSAGKKPCDSLCLPLSWKEHDRQHRIGEKEFYAPYGGVEKAKELANFIYENRYNYDLCVSAIKKFRVGCFYVDLVS